MPRTRVKDINIYYEVHGEGPPLLLIQGIASRGISFGQQVPALAKHFQTIIFDNRGVGMTDQPRAPYSIAQMADDAARLLDALGIQSGHVFGVSMGGMIAQELVLRHPNRVRHLALGCTHSGVKWCIPPPRWATDILYSTGKSRERIVRDTVPVNFASTTLGRNAVVVESVINQMLNNRQEGYAYAQQLAAMYEFDSYDRLGEIRTPTLVMTGREDVMVPPANAALLAERIPGAHLVQFDDAGHFFFIEQAAQTNQVLINFFSCEGISKSLKSVAT